MSALPPVPAWNDVHRRLQIIFPEGAPHRDVCTWEIAARTVFVALFVGAVQGRDTWLRPDQVTRMTDGQAAKCSDAERLAWAKESLKSSRADVPGRWYAANTRESIRDDTIRNGLIQNGAVVERPNVAITSPLPRYALEPGFAALFDPSLSSSALEAAANTWRSKFLSSGQQLRIAVMKMGSAKTGERIKIDFPNGESRLMNYGPSAVLSKAVIEEFSPRFLRDPAVLFLSESREKVVSRDDAIAKKIGLNIEAAKNLPDIILADLGTDGHPLLIFVEVVATDGPVHEARKSTLAKIADDAGFPAEHLAFVTTYLDRSSAPFKKTINELAWGSYAWFAAEPEGLLELSKSRKSLHARSRF